MTEANDPMVDWQALARQSWEAWSEFAHRAGMSATNASATTGAPDTASATVERMLDGLQGWLQWMQSTASMEFPDDNWQAALQQMFAHAGHTFAQPVDGIDSAGEGLGRMLLQWMGAWRNPGAGLRGWLDIPAFGYAREQQQLQQQIVAAMLDYGEQQKRYLALIARANLAGIERLQTMLAEHNEPSRQVDSLRALYDLWVDAAEEAYTEMALSAEFHEACGALINAQMRMRSLQQKQVGQLALQIGMPTRSEFDSLGRRLQEVRRELRASNTSALADEVAALRAEVEALREGAKNVALAKKKSPKKRVTGNALQTAARKSSSKKVPARKPSTKR